jgi:hypothetical protein
MDLLNPNYWRVKSVAQLRSLLSKDYKLNKVQALFQQNEAALGLLNPNLHFFSKQSF